jgi:hypothetical protein
VRKALKTRNWEEGLRLAREWEKEGIREKSVSVNDACDRFIGYQTSRNLRASSLSK